MIADQVDAKGRPGWERPSERTMRRQPGAATPAVAEDEVIVRWPTWPRLASFACRIACTVGHRWWHAHAAHVRCRSPRRSPPRPDGSPCARRHGAAYRLNPRSRLLKRHRYYWFRGRILALEALGRVVEEHGSVAARMCADAVLARFGDGLDLTTLEGAYVVREAAHRLGNAGTAASQVAVPFVKGTTPQSQQRPAAPSAARGWAWRPSLGHAGSHRAAPRRSIAAARRGQSWADLVPAGSLSRGFVRCSPGNAPGGRPAQAQVPRPAALRRSRPRSGVSKGFTRAHYACACARASRVRA